MSALRRTDIENKQGMAVQDVKAWKHSDFLCHNYVLNGLVGSLYNVYCKTMTAKELWESLERKHKTEDAGTSDIKGLLPILFNKETSYVSVDALKHSGNLMCLNYALFFENGENDFWATLQLLISGEKEM
ncbi:hypothetical protein Tco_0893651 [Tanacetum coccineum]|uniref:Uncharacterized protein n=1 Tax=Tanacetum coccineum TaxID=301880 RepID=A0ABQ5CEV5_9ASTR